MKLYNASESQKCEICEFEVSHNKQGRFTSHLKNEHNISLDDYLIKYFYNEDDLNCSYELCDNKVGLRRGKPKKYCCTSCGSKGKPKTCVICGKKFDIDTRSQSTQTCSDECSSKLKSKKTANWHKGMSKEYKEKHFEGLGEKVRKARKKKYTPAWNKGLTGIYSEEAIEKMRQNTLKQMENQEFKKTQIEKIMESYLNEIKIKFKYSAIIGNRQYDFLLIDYNILIECDGDYWHANPKFYPTPKDWQIDRIHIDQLKNEIAQNNGYKIIRFWEDDIINNFEFVKSSLNDLLTTTKLEISNRESSKISRWIKTISSQVSKFQTGIRKRFNDHRKHV